MFNNKFVCCIKSKNKILREFKDVVKLPFGTEFTILLKNLNTVRAQVSVSIDGTNATENVYLVVEPNSEFELTRYIKNGNLTKGNHFKFIERTGSIEQHRGIKAEDGLVRVEFQFEKPTVDDIDEVIKKLEDIQKSLDKKADKVNVWCYPYYTQPERSPTWLYGTTTCGAGDLVGQTITTAAYVNQVGSVQSSTTLGTLRSSVGSSQLSSTQVSGNGILADVNDAGITVPGSESNQKFSLASNFEVETEKHVIVLKLVGISETGVQYVAPVTVKAKPTCQTCGRVNKATSKFCNECGTALLIL